jgi:hypothetical protein
LEKISTLKQYMYVRIMNMDIIFVLRHLKSYKGSNYKLNSDQKITSENSGQNCFIKSTPVAAANLLVAGPLAVDVVPAALVHGPLRIELPDVGHRREELGPNGRRGLPDVVFQGLL